MSVHATAAVIAAPGGDFALTPVELDDPRPDEVIVAITAAGICHTDILARDGLRPPNPPAVLGHEGAGIIERVGADVTGLSPGDRVVLSYASCGRCRSCARGKPAHCPDFTGHNYAGARPDGSPTLRGPDGAVVNGAFFGQSSFATRALIRARQAVRVPDDIDLGLAGPLGCAVQTGVGTVLNTLRPAAGEPVVVVGTGAVGLSAIMGAVIAGCVPIAVDVVPERLRLARDLGAVLTFDGRDEALADTILADTDGGAPYIIDATGNPKVLPGLMRALGVGGTYAVVGAVATGTTVPVDLQHLGRGRHLLGVVEGDSDPQRFIPRLAGLWRSGQLPLDRIVRRYPMTEINRAVREMLQGDVVKPVISFTGEC